MLGNLLSGGAADLVKGVGGVIDDLHTSEEEKLEAKKEEVVEAMRKRRTMEILKERDILKERKLRERKETAILDEVASNLWKRKI